MKYLLSHRQAKIRMVDNAKCFWGLWGPATLLEEVHTSAFILEIDIKVLSYSKGMHAQ